MKTFLGWSLLVSLLITSASLLHASVVPAEYVGNWREATRGILLQITPDGKAVWPNEAMQQTIKLMDPKAQNSMLKVTVGTDGSLNLGPGTLSLSNEQLVLTVFQKPWMAFVRTDQKNIEAAVAYEKQHSAEIAKLVNARKPEIDAIHKESVEKIIRNNLRKIASAAQRYMVNYKTSSVTYADLVKECFFPPMRAFDGEDYTKLTITKDSRSIELTSASGVAVKYDMP